MSKGIDYGIGHVSGQTIKEAGFEFVCRYLSRNPRKNLSPEELADFRSAGLSVVLVWETSERRCLNGQRAGLEDAQLALSEARDLGLVELFKTPTVYFACDDDFSDDDLGDIEDYFEGVNKVFGIAHTGVYGGLRVVSDIMGNGLASYGWQTSAWSERNGILTWEPKAQLRQVSYKTILDHVQCDVNEANQPDFGQIS